MNILDSLSLNLDGKSRGNLCTDCYRERYKREHYKPVHPSNGDDGVIEGVSNWCC